MAPIFISKKIEKSMNILLIICFMSSALFSMESETDSQPLMLKADKYDFVAIDIATPSFKESFKDAVNKGDILKTQECLEQISIRLMPDIALDCVIADCLNEYFELRSNTKEFMSEYVQAIEESKQPQLIKHVMKLTKERLQKSVKTTRENYNQEQLKKRCQRNVFLGLTMGVVSLYTIGLATFGIMRSTNVI